MKISVRAIIYGMLFVILYTGFQGGRYFLANRIQEIGLLFALILFIGGAVFSALLIREKDLHWNWWVGATLVFLAYTVILPAQRFSANTGVSIVPSLLASREFLMAVLCPALYFLYRLGFKVEDIERVLIVTLVALILSYLVHYNRMNLEAAYFSSDHTVAGLVTYDPWRGYRLKPPSAAFYLLTIFTPVLIFSSKNMIKKIFWTFILLIIIYIWLLISARSALGSMALALFAYHLFFAKKGRIGIFYAFLPFGVIILYFGIVEAISILSKLDPETDGVRYKAGSMALKSFLNTPLFGFGQQSNSTLTEQKIFWYKFYSADLGLVGVLFKYGAVGGAVYVLFSYYLIQRMIITNWKYKKKYGRINLTIFGLLILYILYAVNIFLVPFYTYIPGITAASFGVALTAIWQYEINRNILPLQR